MGLMNTEQIIAKLQQQAGVLRNDGVSVSRYLSELSYLIFLKMVDEQGLDVIPLGYQWSDLLKLDGVKLLDFYRKLLMELGREEITISKEEYNSYLTDGNTKVGKKTEGDTEKYFIVNDDSLLKKIFKDASTSITSPKNLKNIINVLEDVDWFSEDRESLGDMYEGLLEKNGEDSKSGAGQYFTPRAVIDAIIMVMKPQVGQKLLDPAAGTFGFMVAANKYIRENNELTSLPADIYDFQISKAFSGMELVGETYRLALMNALLHNIQPENLKLGNSLSENGEWMRDFDMVLTNPPFGIGNEPATRTDVTYNSSNKQLNFLQIIYKSLKKDGKASAAVVIPDGVLSGNVNQGPLIRKDLLNKTNLHTILRLPTGIFYKPGVKTYVLFFTRGESDYNNTKETWVYDLRSLNHFTPKQNKLTFEDFSEFIKLYKDGDLSKRSETYSLENPNGRWRKYTIDEILATDDINLDLHWIREEEEIRTPEEIMEEYEAERAEIDAEIDSLLVDIRVLLNGGVV